MNSQQFFKVHENSQHTDTRNKTNSKQNKHKESTRKVYHTQMDKKQ